MNYTNTMKYTFDNERLPTIPCSSLPGNKMQYVLKGSSIVSEVESIKFSKLTKPNERVLSVEPSMWEQPLANNHPGDAIAGQMSGRHNRRHNVRQIRTKEIIWHRMWAVHICKFIDCIFTVVLVIFDRQIYIWFIGARNVLYITDNECEIKLYVINKLSEINSIFIFNIVPILI